MRREWKRTETGDLSQFCAEGVTVEVQMIDTVEGVSLRLFTFTPPAECRNPVVLFVGGWITQISAWKIVLREMTKDFKIIYVETREKISSKVDIDAHYSVEEIADDLVQLVERLNLQPERFVFFGSSLGASAIIESYKRLTRKPLAMVLVGPNAVFRVPLIWKIIVTLFYPPLYALVKPPAKWYLKTFRLDVQTDREQYEKYCSAIDAADPWKLKKAVLSVAKYSIWNRLADLDRPVLLVDASKDRLHEPENLQKMEAIISQATRIDLGTNKETHSERVVHEFRKFVLRIK
jgi:pimeloyl-ACP methyl ester carboxylesterase